MARSAVHLNGNLLCAVDTETTGLVAGFHDIIQISVIPLTPALEPIQPFFTTRLQPKRPQNFDDASTTAHKITLQEATEFGIDPWTAVELFDEWFNSLKLPERKKIVPLGHNFPFDRDFIKDFLGGILNYDHVFRSDFRDTMHTALFLNDLADYRSEPIPFPKVNLKYLCSQLGVAHENAHDAFADCVACVEVYKKLLKFAGLFTAPLPRSV
jgi:DNA polymerase III epsilon subunit-like protein